MRAGIKSGPAAFCTFSFLRRARIPSVVMFMSGMIGDGSPSGVGMLELSSLVNTEWYCRFRMLAFSVG
ncbi:hypothetical protein DPMN_102838 [Dreissena polymorpha]|uniref:Uncharacterized protein n=1 Tax=Dreissena polymorpha TaxID=45954 RepID=A0A9D4JZJ3_DREPO|nr:hypothetical protein DPMN_102838 [Dreissena polymorpha]